MKSKQFIIEDWNVDISFIGDLVQVIIGGGIALSLTKEGWNKLNKEINSLKVED